MHLPANGNFSIEAYAQIASSNAMNFGVFCQLSGTLAGTYLAVRGRHISSNYTSGPGRIQDGTAAGPGTGSVSRYRKIRGPGTGTGAQ